MGSILSSYIFPHPPIIVPEVGHGREREAADTVNAVERAAAEIAEERPTTIIVTTPHGPVFQDYIYISTECTLEGDLESFGADDVKLEFKNNIDLVNSIISQAKHEGIPAGGLEESIAKNMEFQESWIMVQLCHYTLLTRNYPISSLCIWQSPACHFWTYINLECV